MHEINSRLEELELLDAISYRNFTVYPLGGPASSGPYRTLDEALAMCERGEIVDLKTELGVRRMLARRDGQEK